MSAERNLKCVIVGDGDTGKTCLLAAYSTNKFLDAYVPTIFDDSLVTVEVKNKQYPLALIDTAGQEEYDRLRPLSYSSTNVFLLCFSSILPSSFENIRQRWRPELLHYCPNIPYLLISTKIDLRDDKRYERQIITTEQGEKLAKEIKAKRYIETSAKTQENVKFVFEEAVSVALKPLDSRKKKRCVLL